MLLLLLNTFKTLRYIVLLIFRDMIRGEHEVLLSLFCIGAY